MDLLQEHLTLLRSSGLEQQNRAFHFLMEATKQPVAWAYTVWDDLLTLLRQGDNRQRAIAAQVLCSLAKSDPEGRMVTDLEALLAVTKDERFVTARHCMQSLWQIGVAGEGQRALLLQELVKRFEECGVEKNGTLIRYDILQNLKHIHNAVRDATLPEMARKLIALEQDAKYRKKYLKLWPNSLSAQPKTRPA